MLLPRIGRHFRSRHAFFRCESSVGNALYSPKVRALPFKATKEEAMNLVGVHASAYCLFRDFFASLGARFLPNSGFKPIQPAQIQAVYLPVWIIDAEVEAKAWLPTKSDARPSQQTVIAAFTNSYMPGFAYDPLSRLSFNDVILEKYASEMVPFAPELMRQQESDILCLPYQFTPFSLPDAARSLSFMQATVSDDFRFDPTSVKPHLFAAFPVLMPVYLMKYEVQLRQLGTVDLTIVIEAYRPKGIWYMDISGQRDMAKTLEGDEQGGLLHRLIQNMGDTDFLPFKGSMILPPDDNEPFVHVDNLSDTHNPTQRRVELKDWLDSKLSSKDAMDKYHHFWKSQSNGVLDFEDPRIREYTGLEKLEVKRYLRHREIEAEMRKLVSTLNTLSEYRDKDVTIRTISFDHESKDQSKEDNEKSDAESQKESSDNAPKDSSEPSTVKRVGPIQFESLPKEKFEEKMKDQLESLKRLSEKNKPKWYKEWEEQNDPEKRSTSSPETEETEKKKADGGDDNPKSES